MIHVRIIDMAKTWFKRHAWPKPRRIRNKRKARTKASLIRETTLFASLVIILFVTAILGIESNKTTALREKRLQESRHLHVINHLDVSR